MNSTKMEEESDDKDDSKRKSRNASEKKRRDQFNSLVNDLSALISTSNRKMDKSTVLKSTIAFLKHHNEATDRSKVFEIQQDWKPTFLSNDEFTHLMLESLDGFIIVFSCSGTIFYASESITSQLGYLPSDLMNTTIYDIIYETDHESLFNIFANPKPVIEPLQTDINALNQITFYAYLKRGGVDKLDATSYELVKFVGYFRNDANVELTPSSSPNTQPAPRIFQMNPNTDIDKKLVFVGTGRIQTPQLIREMSAIDPTRNVFSSKHSMEWKFLYLDERAPPIIGYMSFEVLGTSGYDYYHFDDLENIVACHEQLMQKGEGKSCYYRFLTKGQQWIWLQTDFYVAYHQYNAKPDYVECTHKVVSYAEVVKNNKQQNSKTSNKLNHATATPTGASMTPTTPQISSTLTLLDLEVKPNISQATVTTAVMPSAITTTTVSSVSANTNGLLNVVETAKTAKANSTTLHDVKAAAPTPTSNSLPALDIDIAAQIAKDIATDLQTTTQELTNAADISVTITSEHSPGATEHLPLWGASGAQRGTQLNPYKTARSVSSHYGNCSSTGISPPGKKKRYTLSVRGNESDSTSLSAESGISRQSLLTHTSMNRQTNTVNCLQQHSSPAMHQHHQTHAHSPYLNNHSQTDMQHQQQNALSAMESLLPPPAQLTMALTSQHMPPTQKYPSLLPPHSIGGPALGSAHHNSNACQFTPPAFPLHSPTIAVAPTFLEPPQYLAAVPLQPMLSPFPVAPVISPLSNSTADMLSGAVVMTPSQSQLQDQLQRKHDEIEQMIMQQQDELRLVKEQLLLARCCHLLQPVAMPIGYQPVPTTTAPSTNRPYTYAPHGNMNGHNAVQQNQTVNGGGVPGSNNHNHQSGHNNNSASNHNHHNHNNGASQTNNDSESLFNSYNFTVNEQQTQQQLLLQSATSMQHVPNDQQQVHAAPHTNMQTTSAVATPHETPEHHQQQQSNLLPRDVPDLEDIDCFFNLSVMPPLSLGSVNASNNNSQNHSSNNNRQPQQHPPHQTLTPSFGNNNNTPQLNNEDSLLSYMQMANDSSPSLNFPMGISDDGSETPSEETKFLQHQQQMQQLQDGPVTATAPSQQQTSVFFGGNPFQQQSPNQPQSQQQQQQTTQEQQQQQQQHLANNNEIVPFQMCQELSQNLFTSPHAAHNAQ